MTATAHALIGGAIASSVQNPALGLPLAAISHPLTDLIPHWDFGFNWRTKPKLRLFSECIIDLCVGFVLAYLFFGQQTEFWYFATAIFVAEVWDIIEAPYWFFKWDFPPFSWIYEIQHRLQIKAQLPWGIITQVVTVAVVILIFQTLTFP